jgi:hypothetical protein
MQGVLLSKLLDRLSDPAKSGVYRAKDASAIREALSSHADRVVQIATHQGKDALLASMAKALSFPDWFGANWDALEDCLTDLSWLASQPRVLLFTGPIDSETSRQLVEVLAAAAKFWREQKVPFFAVFVDPEGKTGLRALYRESQG